MSLRQTWSVCICLIHLLVVCCRCKVASFALVEDIRLLQGMWQYGVALYNDTLYTISGESSYSIHLSSTLVMWKSTNFAMPKGTYTFQKYTYIHMFFMCILPFIH